MSTSGGSSAPSGAAGGDLSGTYPNPAVAKIKGVAVKAGTPADGNVLTYSVADGEWEGSAPAAAGFAVKVATPAAGTAFVNGALTFLTWTAPNDGAAHFAIVCGNIIAAGQSGGGVTLNYTFGGQAFSQLLAGQSVGSGPSALTSRLGFAVDAGTSVTLTQTAPQIVGSASLFAAIVGS